jgi:YD repeat-containing protein
MRHVRNLMLSRPFLTRVPDQTLLASPAGDGADHVQATRDADGSYAFVYLPTGRRVSVDLRKLRGPKLKAWWFDPRTGTATAAGEIASDAPREFDPPGEPGRGNDWVLVLDDASSGFPPPGQPR